MRSSVAKALSVGIVATLSAAGTWATGTVRATEAPVDEIAPFLTKA